LNKTCVGQSGFYGIYLTANFNLAGMSVKFAAWLRLCAVLCEAPKQAVNLTLHQDGERPSTGIPDIEASTAEI
jgi:hypothetical protein